MAYTVPITQHGRKDKNLADEQTGKECSTHGSTHPHAKHKKSVITDLRGTPHDKTARAMKPQGSKRATTDTIGITKSFVGGYTCCRHLSVWTVDEQVVNSGLPHVRQ